MNYTGQLITPSREPIVTDREWDSFVKRQIGNLAQTVAWGNFKERTGWEAVRRCETVGGELAGTVQMLVKRVAPFVRVGVIREGPVADDDEIVCVLLRRVLRQANLVILQREISAENQQSLKLLPNIFPLLPTATTLIDVQADDETLLMRMKKKTRYSVRRAIRDGLTARAGTTADLPIFYRLHVESAERMGFHPASLAHYETMWRTLSPQYARLVLVEYEGEPIAAQLMTMCGDTVTGKRTGWSVAHRKLRPNGLLEWECMLWAREQGYRYYDLEGIEPAAVVPFSETGKLPEELYDTPTYYKMGYGGAAVFTPPTYLYVRNPLLRLAYKEYSKRADRLPDLKVIFDRLRV